MEDAFEKSQKTLWRGLWNRVHVRIGESVNPEEASSGTLEQIIADMTKVEE